MMIPEDLDLTAHEETSGFDTALSIFFALAVGVLFALVLVVALTFLW
jgi:hypothetical protein